ncbi:thioredoxin family protein [Amylibacter sp. IMCC11727]|uniref:thioredoxin family protein n=1 Tax=Amylibacter sp. IMCC11727 TaxID=3039851 RepID=UPI00244DAB68|nr:thioredoxin family protein [Amylibacter sp. IMCC11727]WGI21303.1 thioredoxin family protein [Amylibacter sp. IMCC11727]
MAKRRSKSNRAKSTYKSEIKATDQKKRKTLRLLRNLAIATPVVGVAGFFSVKSVQATICEADLTKVGKGVPSIVQIHDPNCQLCAALQNQSRRALKSFEKDSYRFLVANIRTDDGSAFAAKYRVPHVTLLLFDKKGGMTQVVRGPIDQDALENILSAHMKRYG